MHSSFLLTVALLASTGLAVPASSQRANGNGANAAAASTSSSTSAAKASASPSQSANNGAKGTNNGGGAGKVNAAQNNGVGQEDLTNAVNGWMADTGKVSNFLNKATSFSGDQFTNEAKIALDAETDELNHKAVIDSTKQLASDPNLKQANDTLATQGAFQAVVDALQNMVNEGPDTAQKRVDEINQNRCVNVLPNIDMYMAVAGEPQSSAIRPSACATINNDPAVNPSVIPDGVGAKGNSKADAATAPAPTSTGASNNSNNANSGNNANSNGNSNNAGAAATTSSSSAASKAAAAGATSTKASAAAKATAASASANANSNGKGNANTNANSNANSNAKGNANSNAKANAN